MINAIDCSKWVGSPSEKEFIVQDWLSLGEVSFLKGEREVGKSLLAQQLMTSVATGKPLLNMDVKQVKAYGVFCESSKRDIIRRQCMIDRLYQVEETLFESQIQILARDGEDNLLMTFNDKGIGEFTPFFHELFEDIQLFQPKLVVLDTISDLFGGDPSHLKQFMDGCCAHIAKTLNCAVLVCEHDSSITICDDIVWHLSMLEEVKDERTLYCGESSHLLRYQNGVFVI
ncbi:AAA family ATPase [Wolbachia endosymbiont of Delia radicum]|uniref:AAA family ATPase n=1 Tax=Wolbachia endosymbiont of Delia radicum TaxID=502352 RepID=UPI001F37433C|nr:AAA family ATPase [Wolbachia endosymbiont of Delia radicum]UJQ20810.1 AAA family ATPase [Wolbachia endosymbiont of Delia radicum]